MRLKSYLRGLGIGIIVTACILHFSETTAYKDEIINENETYETQTVVNTESIEEIEEIEQKVEVNSNEKETLEEALAADTQGAVKEESEALENDEAKETEATENGEAKETDIAKEMIETKSAEEEELLEIINQANQYENEDIQTVEITIVKGDDSGTVARKLYNAGLVDNANEFDYYLMQHGYDKKISIGTFSITVGSSWTEIAQKLSGN